MQKQRNMDLVDLHSTQVKAKRIAEATVIRVALFDMAGTTVDDLIQKPNFSSSVPLVIGAYDSAFRKGGVELSFDELNGYRGKNKIDVFRAVMQKYRTDLSNEERNSLAQRLHDEEFVPALLENVPYLKEMPGTSDLFAYLKEQGVYVATGSGFPQVVTDAINRQLGWQERGLVQFGICGETAGGGRPKPNMINATLVAAGVLPKETDLSKKVEGFDYSVLLKTGDTTEDIYEGNNVGATVIAVSSGTQSVETLVQAGSRVVLPSVAALRLYLDNHVLLERAYQENQRRLMEY